METQSKVLKWSLIIGIIIVINLFFNYSLSLVYKQPDYNKYFTQEQVVEPIIVKEKCLEVGGQWNEGDARYNDSSISKPNTVKGWCDPDFTKRQAFEKIVKSYDRNVFITLVLLGAICVALGTFLKANFLIGTALSMAGVLSFIIASMRYWTSADDLVKVIILAIALAILIWVALKKFKNNL